MEVWEAVVTFLLFPLLVGVAYWADKGFPFRKTHKSIPTTNDKQIELGAMLSGEGKLNFLLFFPLPFFLCLQVVHHTSIPAAGRRDQT